MSSFALKYPFFILMMCLFVIVVGVTTVTSMPVDLFPEVNIPVVVVATFYAGMPPQQIESDITNSYERFFTLGSGIDHIESRSLPGVSLIKIYFQPGTDGNAAVSNISNLAMANLRRLPPGTLPPVVLKFDAANLPVCLDYAEGTGAERDSTERPGAIHCSKSGRERSWSVRSSTLRWSLPADHGVRRSGKTRSTSDERYGCGGFSEQIQPHSSCG